ncbi:MAG TPA: CpaF family protein [Acetivibrio clariflavus]|nr:CpaF family protein [Acetivibrio clariflavus]
MGAFDKANLVAEVKKTVSDSIDLGKDISDEEIRELITSVVFEKSKHVYLTVSEKREICEAVFNSMRRLDILQPLIDDPSITEIMVNGADDIFIERNGRIEQVDAKFESIQKLEDVIQSIVSKVNRSVNEASPIVDARLSDGSRVNVVLKPIALNGPIMTIRKFPEKPMTVEQLINYGSLTEEAAKVLEAMVRAKYNIFVCGGTGSGKTTFLNALSNFIPKDERIITIEDSAELQITGIKNIVRLETRNANTEGKGEITIRDLIKTSLRMRPERIIVGEVRGAEALDMLQAMNTGHDGSLSTGHANSSRDMLSRLETMVLSGALMPIEAIRQQIASAIDILIHLGRIRDKSRKVLEISEVVGYKDGNIQLNPLYEFVEEGETKDGRVLGSLKRTGNEMVNTLKFKMAGISCKV